MELCDRFQTKECTGRRCFWIVIFNHDDMFDFFVLFLLFCFVWSTSPWCFIRALSSFTWARWLHVFPFSANTPVPGTGCSMTPSWVVTETGMTTHWQAQRETPEVVTMTTALVVPPLAVAASWCHVTHDHCKSKHSDSCSFVRDFFSLNLLQDYLLYESK